MIDKKPPKFYWTSLGSNKNGKVKDNLIKLKVPEKTHVWRKADLDDKGVANAPFYFRKITGDFEATVKVKANMKEWLDQAGLLLQEKRGVYTKVSLEYHDNPHATGNLKYHVACYVHPEDQLDMDVSKTPFPGQFKSGDKKYSHVEFDKSTNTLWLKLNRLSGFIEASYSLDGDEWIELKASRFTEADTLSIGIFGASGSADGEGFKCTFEDLVIEEDDDDDEDEDDDDNDDDEEEEEEKDEEEEEAEAE
jgi:regulation of enolase protein 1 (concanavalin A-like superfamily)